MRPWRGVSPGDSARWRGRGPGEFAATLAKLRMELRELLMAGTTAFGAGVDPARITLAAGRLTSAASSPRSPGSAADIALDLRLWRAVRLESLAGRCAAGPGPNTKGYLGRDGNVVEFRFNV